MKQTPFQQRILVARPPVWDRCVKVFGQAAIDRPGVIWSWGRVIYNPSNVNIPNPLRAHEAVHGQRQIEFGGALDVEDVVDEDRINGWWEQYLTSPAFRLQEEVLAHHAEYMAYRKRHGQRRQDLEMITARLAGDLYGGIIRPQQAKHAVLTGAMP